MGLRSSGMSLLEQQIRAQMRLLADLLEWHRMGSVGDVRAQRCQQQEALMKCAPLTGFLGAVTCDCGSCVPGAVQLPVHSSALSGMALLMGSTTLGCFCCRRLGFLELWSRTSQPATSPLIGGLLPAVEISWSLTLCSFPST